MLAALFFILAFLIMKQKLLLLHGALGSAAMFDKLSEELKSNFEIFKFNFSGHGGKAFLHTDFSIKNFAEELEEYIEIKTLSPANIFGYSMGGYVALWLAKNKPHLINAIFTLGTKLNWNSATAEKEIKMLDANKMEIKIPAFANELKQRHAPNDWKKVVTQTAMLIKQLGNNHLTNSDFEKINTGILLTIGDSDNMVTSAEAQSASLLMQNAQFKVLPQTFHSFEKVDAHMLAEEVQLFFI